jgi:hypothetical protein
MSDKARIAALGEEIRQAGHDTRWARRAIAGFVLAPFIAFGLWGLILRREGGEREGAILDWQRY